MKINEIKKRFLWKRRDIHRVTTKTFFNKSNLSKRMISLFNCVANRRPKLALWKNRKERFNQYLGKKGSLHNSEEYYTEGWCNKGTVIWTRLVTCNTTIRKVPDNIYPKPPLRKKKNWHKVNVKTRLNLYDNKQDNLSKRYTQR